MFHHSVWSVITAHKLTPAKRNVTTGVSDQRSRFTAPSIGDYNTPDTVAKHRRRKVAKKCTERNSPVTEYTHKTNNETKHQSHANLQHIGSKQPNLFTDVPRE